jgi:hypothetical protein
MSNYNTSEALQRFISRLPSHPYCTNDLSFGIKPLAAYKAIEKAYIQPNRPNAAYDLGYLAEFVDLKPLPRQAANDDSTLGRNCSLFNAICKRVYTLVGECVDEQQLFIRVLNACLNYNAEAFCTPLGDAEVRNTAKGLPSGYGSVEAKLGRLDSVSYS